MKMKLRVIRDGDPIFEWDWSGSSQPDFPELTRLALIAFKMKHHKILLTDEDVILKWSEADLQNG